MVEGWYKRHKEQDFLTKHTPKASCLIENKINIPYTDLPAFPETSPTPTTSHFPHLPRHSCFPVLAPWAASEVSLPSTLFLSTYLTPFPEVFRPVLNQRGLSSQPSMKELCLPPPISASHGSLCCLVFLHTANHIKYTFCWILIYYLIALTKMLVPWSQRFCLVLVWFGFLFFPCKT